MGIFKRKDQEGKPSGPWYIQFPHRMDPVTERVIYTTRSGGQSKRMAQRHLSKNMLDWEKKKLLGRVGTIKDRTVEQVLNWYLSLPSTKAKRSYDRDQSRANTLIQHMGQVRLSRLKVENVEALQQKLLQTNSNFGRPFKPATVNRHVALLKAAMNKAVKDRLIAANPVLGIKMLDEDNQVGKALTSGQYKDLMQHLPLYAANIVKTAYLTGMRFGEILKLKWGQVDLDQGFISLSGKDTKSKRGRMVPLCSELKGLFQSIKPENPKPSGRVFKRGGKPINSIRGAFKKACDQAELKDVRFHDLRHTFVTNARKAGLDRSVIKSITGHLTDSMFERYSHVGAEDLLRAAESIQRFKN